jgi:hypothetical protein
MNDAEMGLEQLVLSAGRCLHRRKAESEQAWRQRLESLKRADARYKPTAAKAMKPSKPESAPLS